MKESRFMTTDDINTLLATRAADLLAKWAGLPMASKLQIGDVNGMGVAFMAISGMAKNGDVKSPTHAAIVAYVKKIIDRSRDGAYVTFDTDYGPGRALQELSGACGVPSNVWPAKSMMSVNKIYSDGSGSNSVSVSTGYHGRTTTHYLTDDGWLVAGTSIAPCLHDVVRRACERGELDKNVATWEPKAS